MAITTIAFDLDDTLLNTSGILVPTASQIAFNMLISHGLKLTPEQCEKYRVEMIKTISHKDVFKQLSEKFGDESTHAILPQATRAFYEPDLPLSLPLLEEAAPLLDYLHTKYHLYIVTAGFESGQRNKVRSLKIEKYFKDIFVINSLEGERKIKAFKKILELEQIAPENLLCVGNSLSSEIKDAKELGAISCYFEFGEDRGVIPTAPHLKPDYHIKNLSQLITVCKL